MDQFSWHDCSSTQHSDNPPRAILRHSCSLAGKLGLTSRQADTRDWNTHSALSCAWSNLGTYQVPKLLVFICSPITCISFLTADQWDDPVLNGPTPVLYILNYTYSTQPQEKSNQSDLFLGEQKASPLSQNSNYCGPHSNASLSHGRSY